MKRILTGLFLFLFFISLNGCANFNPKLNNKIDNQNGKIDEIRNNQNGMMLEVGKLKQEANIQNSQLKEVQNGMLNLNAAITKNENSGIQILQGDGALILVFSLGVIGMLLFYYRNKAVVNEKAAQIMAGELNRFNNPQLKEEVFRAALYSPAESKIYHLLTKFQKI